MQDIKKGGMPIISQLISYIPLHIIDQAVEEHESDKYYKRLKTKEHLAFILYGVIGKLESLNALVKSLAFLGKALIYFGITQLPARSTLADANRNRKSDVFGKIYLLLADYYKIQLSGSYLNGMIDKKVDMKNVKIFDSTTFTLFVDVFTGAGRNKIEGKKKGGIKAHILLSLHSLVPEIVWMSAASKNDKDFLGQLNPQKGEIYVFDKGYVNYNYYSNWTELGVFFVTRLNENGKYEVLESKEILERDAEMDGVIKDEIIILNTSNGPLRARLITFKSLTTAKTYTFLSNLFDVSATTIAKLYKNRWEIEPFFKQLKQNFELKGFFSDSQEGIRTQIWVALIANLIFTVIHRQIKQDEAYSAMVQMARANMGSFIRFIDVLKVKYWRGNEKNVEKIQLDLFKNLEGVLLKT
jgi:IS4 transposase